MTVEADLGEKAQRQAERAALRKVRHELDSIRNDERRQRRVLLRIAIVSGIVLLVVAAAFALFLADARERRTAAESPLPAVIVPATTVR